MRKRRKVIYFVWLLAAFILLCCLTLALLCVEESHILGVPLNYDNVEGNDCLKKIDVAIVSGGFESTFRVVTQIKSILANTQHFVKFHFLVDESSSIILRKLFKTWPIPKIETHLYNVSPFLNRIEWIPNTHYSGIYGMVKLLLPEILPKQLDKVILLDTDLLILSDINELWSYFSQMNTSHIYSMTENLSSWYTTRSSIKKTWPALRRGFNSGVALVDLAKMRRIKWHKLWREIAIEHLRYTGVTNLADQDILNALFVSRSYLVYQLPCEFNLQLGLHSDPSLCSVPLEMAKIIHWNSPKKDLNSNSYTNFFNPIYRLYSGMDGKLFSVLRKDCNAKRSMINIYRKKSFDECEMFTQAAGKVYRTHLFVKTFEIQEGPGSISVVSQMSVDRLPLFETLAIHWEESISVAVYGTDEEINNFIDHVSVSEALRKRKNIGIHAVYKHGEFYPINYLRNVAINATYTEFMLLLDIDFVISKGIPSAVRKLPFPDKTVYVIPAFEFTASSYKPLKIPKSKSALIDLWDLKEVTIFRGDVWIQGHGPTDYNRWKTANNTYQVTWQLNYEPYIIIRRSETPFYDERFMGFGWNKVTHIMELHRRNFTFIVLPDAFLTHQSHMPSLEIMKYRSSVIYRKCLRILKETFMRELLNST